MICFQRNSGDRIPGCRTSSSTLASSMDFCVSLTGNSDNNSGGSSGSSGSSGSYVSSSFLKLYWQKGYNWQDESFERRWCMKCVGSQCSEGDIMSTFTSGLFVRTRSKPLSHLANTFGSQSLWIATEMIPPNYAWAHMEAVNIESKWPEPIGAWEPIPSANSENYI